jgi:Tfp pilus assembly protein PilX
MNLASTRRTRHSRHHEQGGIVILVALMLLMLLSVAAFSFSRTVIREIGISGNVFQAGRADAAADAGLDWFIAWESDTQKGNPTPTTATRAKQITDKVNSTYMSGLDLATAPNSPAWKWGASVSGKDGMVLQGASADGSMTQAFNLSLVCLGKDDGAQAGGGETNRGNPSGGTDMRTNVGQLYAWEVISTGQAILPGDAWRFQSIRSAKVVIRPKL